MVQGIKTIFSVGLKFTLNGRQAIVVKHKGVVIYVHSKEMITPYTAMELSEMIKMKKIEF
jgi:hypothetical protein